MDAMEAFWQRFLANTGRPADTRYLEAFHFDLSERVANELLALVLAGVKRATASSLFSWQAEGTAPKPGDLSVITDWDGNPRCVIETTAVTTLPFNQISYAICSREGEDDCLESWQKSHRRFFTEEGAEMGYTFREDLPVVFEDFRVVYQEALA